MSEQFELVLIDDDVVFSYVAREATHAVCAQFYDEHKDCTGCPIRSLCHTRIESFSFEAYRLHWQKREEAAQRYLEGRTILRKEVTHARP